MQDAYASAMALRNERQYAMLIAMKLMIWIGIAVGGTLGGFIGAAFDHGNLFGAWSIIFSGIGSFAGLWGGYKVGKTYF
jgi:hypothetical protein